MLSSERLIVMQIEVYVSSAIVVDFCVSQGHPCVIGMSRAWEHLPVGV